MERFPIRMRKPSPPSMQRFVRYRRSLSGKPLLSLKEAAALLAELA